jgi:glycosyltransferase involved in cell wall biosynthesis
VLWVIMPAYDEDATVGAVLAEWLAALRALETPFRLVAINDGSRDGTLDVLRRVAALNPEVRVVDKPNSGHGQSCVAGYRQAVKEGAAWVLQIDSDGQCDPRFVGALWAARHRHPAVFGRRGVRGDGWIRWGISRAARLAVWLATGAWVVDANVPYRLIRGDALAAVIADIPPDFRLANILLAVRLHQTCGIHWIPIGFRDRSGGSPSVKTGAFLAQGLLLYRQLRRETRAARARR